jgi:phosphoserine phosphatase
LPLAVGPAISQTLGSMLFAVTFAGPDARAVEAAAQRARSLAAAAGEVKSATWLAPTAFDLLVEGEDRAALAGAAAQSTEGLPVDHAIQPADGRRKRLFLADMDSTIVGCEGLDELADYAGVKAEVAAVTERAMRGEIAFEGALRERVSKLQGLPEAVLAQCYAERVRLNPGARVLVRTLAAHGVRCVLVSGGFDAFSAPVAAEAGFQHHHANRLEVEAGRLTGRVVDPILGREAKLQALQRHAGDLGVGLDTAMAVGDGANDLAMIGAAGLGVAYRAKPVVAAEADVRLDHADLSALLYLQGYREADLVVD